MFLKEFELAKNIASSTAEMLQTKYLSDAGIISNDGKDIKTKADRAAHTFIIDRLSNTGISIISEEGNTFSFNINDRQWIIDPIDGTFNMTRGFEMAAVSISLWDNGSPILGVIHDIYSDDVYSSFHNKGAHKNRQRIFLSTEKKKDQAILATGFPTGRDYSRDSLNDFIMNVQSYKKIRMLGSAALMLAYVACGYFDVYHEDDIYIWDVAAGLAIIAEAGGTYSIKPGSSALKYNINASNNYLIDQI